MVLIREERLLSTPHFESTARWAIDKGSVSVWRQKVKRIALLPPIRPDSTRRRHFHPGGLRDYRQLTKARFKGGEFFYGNIERWIGSFVPGPREPLSRPPFCGAEKGKAVAAWQIVVRSLCGEHVDNFFPSSLCYSSL
jgi:hypothetical protein